MSTVHALARFSWRRYFNEYPFCRGCNRVTRGGVTHEARYPPAAAVPLIPKNGDPR